MMLCGPRDIAQTWEEGSQGCWEQTWRLESASGPASSRMSHIKLWELGLAVLAVSGQRTDAKLPCGSRTVLPSLHSVWGKKACLCSYFMSKQV